MVGCTVSSGGNSFMTFSLAFKDKPFLLAFEIVTVRLTIDILRDTPCIRVRIFQQHEAVPGKISLKIVVAPQN